LALAAADWESVGGAGTPGSEGCPAEQVAVAGKAKQTKTGTGRSEKKESNNDVPRMTESDTTCEAPWPSAIAGDVRSSTRAAIWYRGGTRTLTPLFSVTEFKQK